MPIAQRAYTDPMPLTCNIDSRGKVARLIYGIVLIVAGVALAPFWARGQTRSCAGSSLPFA